MTLPLKSKMHVKIQVGNFLIRVYEFKGTLSKSLNVKVKVSIAGDVVLEESRLVEIFSYNEKKLLTDFTK